MSQYIIFCDNSTLPIPLRHVSDPSLLRRANAEDEDRTGFLLEANERDVARDLLSLEVNRGDPHVLNPSTAKDAPLMITSASG
jgi:hypothetical protein